MTEIYMHYHDETAICQCDACGHECKIGEVEMISDFEERVAPGEICPAGECPECGSLMHFKTDKTEADAALAFVCKMASLTTPEDEVADDLEPGESLEKEITMSDEFSNNRRAVVGNTTLSTWVNECGDQGEDETNFRDMLADLMHLADAQGWEFDDLLERARDCHDDEVSVFGKADARFAEGGNA